MSKKDKKDKKSKKENPVRPDGMYLDKEKVSQAFAEPYTEQELADWVNKIILSSDLRMRETDGVLTPAMWGLTKRRRIIGLLLEQLEDDLDGAEAQTALKGTVFEEGLKDGEQPGMSYASKLPAQD